MQKDSFGWRKLLHFSTKVHQDKVKQIDPEVNNRNSLTFICCLLAYGDSKILVFLRRRHSHRQIPNPKENTNVQAHIHTKLATCASTSCHFTQMESIWFPQLMTALPAA